MTTYGDDVDRAAFHSGLSLAVPALAAGINPTYKPYVESAISQIAFAVIFTSVITPYIVKKIANKI
jgi:2-keto-3-deoxygluconate permease